MGAPNRIAKLYSSIGLIKVVNSLDTMRELRCSKDLLTIPSTLLLLQLHQLYDHEILNTHQTVYQDLYELPLMIFVKLIYSSLEDFSYNFCKKIIAYAWLDKACINKRQLRVFKVTYTSFSSCSKVGECKQTNLLTHYLANLFMVTRSCCATSKIWHY